MPQRRPPLPQTLAVLAHHGEARPSPGVGEAPVVREAQTAEPASKDSKIRYGISCAQDRKNQEARKSEKARRQKSKIHF